MKKDWRERELTMEIVVGAFMVMILLGLGYFTIILSKESYFKERHEINVTFADVMGLRIGDNVAVRGMPIGKVKSLALVSADNCAGVCVTLMRDKPIVMREGYSVKIITTSILGGRQLQIYEGPGDAPVEELDLYRGTDPYDLMADAAQIVNAAKKQIIEGAVFEKLRNVVDQIDEVVTRVNAGHGLLGKILSDDEDMYSDLASSASSLREIISRVAAGEGTVGRLLSKDASVYDDLSEAISSIKTISGRLEAGEGTLGKLLSNDDTVYKDLSEATAALKDVAVRISKGEGTIGRLIADETLYNEVTATVSEVRAAVDDFRETSPVTTFTSIFFGAF